MEKDNMVGTVGRVAFIIGVILALIVGLFSDQLGNVNGYIIGALIVLGLIVGFLNITEKETQAYIIATVGLVIVASLGGDKLAEVPMIGTYLVNAFAAMISFIIPGVIVVALKAVYAMAKEE
jgi:hypothetical protein